jgi:hypothetical protein
LLEKDSKPQIMHLTLTENLFYTAPFTSPTWTGFQSRRGPFASVDSPLPATGETTLTYAPEGRGVEPLAPEELALVDWFEAHERSISEAAVAAILEACSPTSANYEAAGFYDGYPLIADLQTLKNHIGLYAIYLHYLPQSKLPYIGFEIGCNWEEEHCLGVLMQGTRLVAIDQADAAFTLWRAVQDFECHAK